MTTTDHEPIDSSPRYLIRFDVVQRILHWVSAVMFVILIATAISLYFGSLFGWYLPRVLVEQIHLWTGVLLPLPFIVSLLGPWGRRMRQDLRRVNRWRPEEISWVKSFATTAIDFDKFNPGQKLNAIFVASASVLLLGTGIVLKWFRFFPVSWRVGATFVHDVSSAMLVCLIVGHVVMALTHREALWSMAHGRVCESWAATHAPSWWREERADSSTPTP